MRTKIVLTVSMVAWVQASSLRAAPPVETAVAVDPAKLPRVVRIDDRYPSYNVEMLEVAGGKFWKPYGSELEAALQSPPAASSSSGSGDTPAGMNPAMYEYQPPIDLTNARLRKLAAALGPAYVRVSGTWANTSFFPADDQAPSALPPGFNGVLTYRQ